jgi:SAM-dependent methyltransferase
MVDSKTKSIDARFQAVTKSRTFRNIVTAFRLNEKAVLDIGCSFGEHLAHFGPGSTGITIALQDAEEGVRRGLDVRVGDAEKKLPIEKTYDAIYCSNLLEHLYTPHRFLCEIRAALKPEGVLILGVPVIPFPPVLMRFRKFRGALAVSHINFFTGDSLRLTAERAGWQVQEIRGFRMRNALLDRLAFYFYPHLYVIAKPDPKNPEF